MTRYFSRSSNTQTATALLTAAMALWMLPPVAWAQEATPATRPAATLPARPSNNGNGPGLTTQPGGGLLLNFREASIDSVLDELSAAAGFIVVKEVRPEGRVTLLSKQPVRSDDAVALLNTVLKNAGYAAIQQGRILKIVQRDRAKKLNIPVRVGSDPTDIEPTDELVTQVIPLRYADATQLKNDLAPLINPEADFTANASSNALVMTDTTANIRRVVQIVAALDTSLADAAEVKVFQLKYANAASAARLINEVFTDQAQGRGGPQQTPFGGFGRFFGQGGPGGGGPGGGDGGRSRDSQQQSGRRSARVQASSDDRTNTLVVTGPTDTLAVVARVVTELDSNPAADEAVFIYHLKNAQAVNVESVVNNLFNGTSTPRSGTTGVQSRRPSANTSGVRAGSGRTTGGTPIRDGASSTGGGRTGGFGTGGFGTGGFGTGGFGTGGFAGFGAVSSSAARTASDLAGQVTIIADTDTNSLLVRTAPGNFERVKAVLAELDRPVAQVLIKVLVAEVTHSNETDIGAQFSVLNLRASGLGQTAGTNFGLGAQTGGLVVRVLEDDFNATIRLLEKQGKLDVLSRPYILASDNQLATITVGQSVPLITNSRITDTGQTINTLSYQDVGILLDVIPHINPDGLVIMDVAPEISALTGETVPISDNASQPVIAKRAAQSRVAIHNGQTVVIGGLMEDRRTQTIEKVPLLGDIPLVGAAFRRNITRKAKTELLIFLTPHVAARPDELRGMSQGEVKGSRLVYDAVEKNAFERQLQGMERGQPPATAPATQEAP